jgi:recombinational DNA repair protein RecT
MKGYLLSFSSFTGIVHEENLTYYHGISDKVRSLTEEMLFLKQKQAERAITHLCAVMLYRNVMTKTNYKLRKQTT